MTKKILIVLGVAVLVIGVLSVSAATSSSTSGGNIFQNFYNQYLKPIFSPAPQTAGNKTVSEYKPVADYEQAVIGAVEQNSKAVVSVIISKNLPVIEQCPYSPFSDLPPEFQQFFGQNFQFSQPCQKGTKLQEVGGGSGFIISSDGLIVTNKHVVADKSAAYTVLTNNGKKYDAKVLARDSATDFAVIKINANNLPVVTLGNSGNLKLGQSAIAIGNALGEFRNTVSVGVISGLARTITASDNSGTTETIEGVIQTDAAINAGNSGGPLLNLRGEVIGINVATVSGAQSIGFAIPIDQVKKAINSVKASGRIVTPYLGVRYLIITPSLVKKENLSAKDGALVRGSSDGPAVIPNSPAAKAGIQAEDIIIKLNDEKITQDNPLASLIQKYNVGDSVSVKILRNGKEILLNKVILEEKPAI